MRVSRCRLLTSVLCLALLPVAVLAEDARALLSISGSVMVNGKPVETGTPIFDGDRIDVGPDSSAGITAAGSVVTLDSNSSLVYHSGNIAFGCGSATLSSTGRPTTAVVNGIEVSYGAQPAKIQITDKDGVLLIKSLSGAAQVKEASGVSSLAEGFSIARPGSANCMAGATTSSTPTESPTNTKTTPTGKPHSNTTLILVLVGVAGAAGVGLAAAGGGKKSDTTPISPFLP